MFSSKESTSHRFITTLPQGTFIFHFHWKVTLEFCWNLIGSWSPFTPTKGNTIGDSTYKKESRKKFDIKKVIFFFHKAIKINDGTWPNKKYDLLPNFLYNVESKMYKKWFWKKNYIIFCKTNVVKSKSIFNFSQSKCWFWYLFSSKL